MRNSMRIAMAGALVACMAVSGALAQEAAPQAAVPMRTIKVAARHYKNLAPADVYRAAAAGIRVPVRFVDAFGSRTVMPESLRQFSLEGVTYETAVAFRTQGGLLCLIPWASEGALRTLFGLPGDWPLSEAVLNRPAALVRGQQLTVEGVIVGAVVGERCVLVESLYMGKSAGRAVQREVLLMWPGERQPHVISAPGTVNLKFPSTKVEGQTVPISVTVKALTPQALRAELARQAAAREGLGTEQKTYREFAADDVYRHAARANRLNVSFQDRVARVLGSRLPAELSSVPALRGGVMGPVGVKYAFELESRVVCLVPSDSSQLLGRAMTVLPGERVAVCGTIVGPQGASNCVLVDYIGFPDQEQGPENEVWWVSIQLPGQEKPKEFWGPGLYDIPFPLPDAPGQVETLRVQLWNFVTVQVPAPASERPAQPEPAPQS